jgi:hypothetical protein
MMSPMKIRFSGLLCISLLVAACRPPVADLTYDLPENVNFNEHIAPIVHANCSPCHRDGGGAPFELITYRDVARRAKMVKQVTADRFMPPWPADPTYSSFVGERTLSADQIAMIAAWADAGAPQGDGAAPVPPLYPAMSMLGVPDLVLSFRDSIHIPADNRDRFMVIKVPFELQRDTFVRAIEFVPGNRQLVHHMNGHLLSYVPEKRIDVHAGFHVVPDVDRTNRSTYEMLLLAHDDGSFPTLTPSVVNYLPGVSPATYPPGIGVYHLPRKGAFLIKNMHYGPSSEDAYDRSHINVFFADGPPKRPMRELMLGTLGESPVVPRLIVPADSVMCVHTRHTLREDISLLTINPHMHLIGKSFLAFALPPGGDTIPLIRIRDWDFRWQYFYTFKKMLKLPKGTIIHAEGVYDNTRDNPNNPFDPPRPVIEPINENMKTTDEMFQFIITYLSYRKGDELIGLEGVE